LHPLLLRARHRQMVDVPTEELVAEPRVLLREEDEVMPHLVDEQHVGVNREPGRAGDRGRARQGPEPATGLGEEVRGFTEGEPEELLEAEDDLVVAVGEDVRERTWAPA